MQDIDTKYNEVYFKEDLIKETEKLPTKIKKSLDNGKIIEKEWDDKNLASKINDCINIEKNIKEFNDINEIIKKSIFNKSKKIRYNINEEQTNDLINKIQSLGKIISDEDESVIMKKNEFNLIYLAIENRFNKKVKEIKKLYQATIDGDDAINFHSKCDNIPNTLVIIKSAGNRRFGGFTSMTWSSPTNYEYKNDPYAFVFSLDKQQIYKINNGTKAILNNKDFGPCFGYGCDIFVGNHCIKEKRLHTYETSSTCSYYYNGDENALSEDGKKKYIYAAEYEVFQVIL